MTRATLLRAAAATALASVIAVATLAPVGAQEEARGPI